MITEPMVESKSNLTFIDHSVSSEIKREGFGLDPYGIQSWLHCRRIVPEDATILCFCDETPWQAIGSETFSTRAFCTYATKTDIKDCRFLLKALVGMNPSGQQKVWTSRRNMLMQMGIGVSQWFSCSSATITEPYYEYGHDTFFKLGFLSALAEVAGLLDGLGFRTLDYISDMRSDGHSLYYIDFGFDLGEPSETVTSHALNRLRSFCQDHDETVPESIYESAQVVSRRYPISILRSQGETPGYYHG